MNGSAGTPNTTMIPLALFSLGVSIFLLAGNAWGMVSDGGYVSFALLTGGVGSFTAGILAYRAGSAFGYVAPCALGAYFASSAFYHWFFASAAQATDASRVWILIAWTVVFFFIAIASFRAQIPAPAIALWVLLFVFFLLRLVSAAFDLDVLMKAAAIDGIVVAVLAWAGGFVTLRDALG